MGRKSRQKARKATKKINATKALDNIRSNAASSFDVMSLPERSLDRLFLIGMFTLPVLVAVALYPALLGGFVWDDRAFTEAMPVMDVSGISTIWFSAADLPSEGHYWPITYTTFWLQYQLWGFEPLPYHIFNVLLHAANSCLVFYLLWRLAVPGALLAAAIFAVHPVHVEPVAWVIGRKDLLSTMFCFCLFLVWIRFREVPKPALWRYALTLVLFVAALFSKSTIVAVPVVLLILQWWKGRRVSANHFVWIAPFFVIGLVYSYLDFSFYQSQEKVSFDLSVLDRFMIATQAFWYYMFKLLWPTQLSVIYPRWEVGISSLYSCLSLVAVVGLVAVLWRFQDKIGRACIAGLVSFVVLLAPVLGFIDYGYMQFAYAADRYQYAASIGLIAVFSSFATWVVSRLPEIAKKCSLIIAAMVLAALAYLSWQQSSIYENEVTFFSHILSLNPVARSANANLSKAFEEAGQLEKALAQGYLAIENYSNLATGYANTGNILFKLNRYEEAEKILRRGIQRFPNDKAIGLNLGESIRFQSRCVDALPYYRNVLLYYPDFPNAHFGLGMCLFNLEQYEQSVVHLHQALNSPLSSSHNLTYTLNSHLGLAYMEQGRYAEATRHFQRASELRPNNKSTLKHLADVLEKQERYSEANEIHDKIENLNS